MGQSRWFNHAQRFPVTLQQPTFLTTAGLCRDGPFPDVALRQPTIRHLVGGYLEGLGHRETEPGCDLEKGSSKRTGRASSPCSRASAAKFFSLPRVLALVSNSTCGTIRLRHGRRLLECRDSLIARHERRRLP